MKRAEVLLRRLDSDFADPLELSARSRIGVPGLMQAEGVRRVGRLRLGDIAEIGDDHVHPVTFRFRLDTSQLPRPFQIGVVGQADWNISAERSARLPLEKAK